MLFLSKRLGDITVNDIAEITPFVVLGLAVVCGICLMIIKIKEAENNALPINGMVATIIDMQQVASNTVAFAIWVMFETEDGTRVRVSCNANENYVVGDKGYLKWQGTRLISFDRGVTCDTEQMKSNGAASGSWICCSCGMRNAEMIGTCQKCGVTKVWSEKQNGMK